MGEEWSGEARKEGKVALGRAGVEEGDAAVDYGESVLLEWMQRQRED